MSILSKIRQVLGVDDPRPPGPFTADDRAFIDEQIRATQQHLVDSLINGVHATWLTLDGSGAAVVAGDVVVSTGNTLGTYTKGVNTTLGGGYIVLQAAAPGARVRVAASGVVPATTVGLSAGSESNAVLNPATGRVVRKDLRDGSEVWLGTVDTQGNVRLGASKQVGTTPHHVVNVRAYGAKGDGTTDDTTATQNALNVFSTGGSSNNGTMLVPRGLSKITSALSYTGDGSHAVIIEGDGDGGATGAGSSLYADATFPTGGTFLTLTALNNSVVRDLSLQLGAQPKYGVYLAPLGSRNWFENVSMTLGLQPSGAAWLVGDGSGTQVSETRWLGCHVAGTNLGITGATNASPIVLTIPSGTAGLTTGQQYEVSSVGGNTAANGTWTITVVDGTHISLNGSTGNGAYTSGGVLSQPTSAAWRPQSGNNTKNFSWLNCSAINTGYYLDVPASAAMVSLHGITSSIYTSTFKQTGGGTLLVLGHNAEGDVAFLTGTVGSSPMQADIIGANWSGSPADLFHFITYAGALGIRGSYFDNIAGNPAYVSGTLTGNNTGSYVSERNFYNHATVLPVQHGANSVLGNDYGMLNACRFLSIFDIGGTSGALVPLPPTIGIEWSCPRMNLPHFANGDASATYGNGHQLGYLADPVTITKNACTGVAAQLKDVCLYGVLAPKTMIVTIIVDVTQGWSGATGLKMSIGKTLGAATEYAAAFDITVTGQHVFQVNALDWTGATAIYAEITSTAGNLSGVSQGSATIYVKADRYN